MEQVDRPCDRRHPRSPAGRTPPASILRAALDGSRPSRTAARQLLGADPEALIATAAALRDRGHRNVVSYSRKVFIPLTTLCRDVCHYCTFARPPRPGERAYRTAEEVLAIARAGAAAGCKEALFTLGDRPEARYAVARRELAALGHPSTISYLVDMAGRVLAETGLLPHANPGVLDAAEIAALRRVSVSQGIMLESVSLRLLEPGGAHHGSPDKHPAARLATIAEAGVQQVPFTTGILIGIGETRIERIDSLLALRELQDRHGHLQELIIQNFRAKDGTRMAGFPEPDLADLRWTIAVARVLFGPEMNIQAPPNLSPDTYGQLIGAGINDWGGISPVTPDHVNPEAPWPHLDELARRTADAGKVLVERLASYPAYVRDAERWHDPAVLTALRRASDGEGFARPDPWSPGVAGAAIPSGPTVAVTEIGADLRAAIGRASAGETLGEDEVVRLFSARGSEFDLVCAAADELRHQVSGDRVGYVVNRNINYTNICYFKCQFCAFSKGKLSESLRGVPYDLELPEIVRRAREAWDRGATEVCMQGGIHPDYTGDTYIRIADAVKQAVPGLHIHAFSPLEVAQGAQTLGLPVDRFLGRLRDAGLGSLPGTAAEVLDDEVRVTLCPDKLRTDEWLAVVRAAHRLGIRTTSTIMYGHIEQPRSWARHLLRLRALQQETGGFTEFVPLPFVHMEAPIYLKGRARRGPTFREAVLMHAVSRLALHPHITNIQASWVKMGPEGLAACLRAGANDAGGTLMNESITRAAGGEMGQELPPAEMERIIGRIGRVPWQRTTLYQDVPAERRGAWRDAPPLAPILLTPVKRYEGRGALSELRPIGGPR